MHRVMRRLKHRLALAGEYLVFQVSEIFFRLVRLLPLDAASAMGGWLMRTFGPLLPVHRIGAENLRLAMPELSEAERRIILRGAWDNLGRMSCEFAHMATMASDASDYENPDARIEIPPDAIDTFFRLRDDGLPALAFSAHLANWELPAILVAHFGLASAALYRTPNNRFIARRIRRTRGKLMGRLIGAGPAAPFELHSALRAGEHVGMLIDQRFGRGVTIPFFGRPAATTTLFARLARNIEGPIYGVRAVRKTGARFRMEVVGPVELPRDAEGNIDVEGATVVVTRIVEDWIRATPEQWLWFHRRWRL